jgi:hypothetical protein
MPDALTVGKSAIKIFTGEYNLLNDYIQDFDLACTLCNVPFDSKLRALSMFQHCSDDVKRVLRQMPPRDLYEPAKIEALLRKHYGLKDVIKASKDITTLVTMKQPKGPFLHKHFMQFMALVMAIQHDDPTMDLKTMNNGKLLKAFFINTLHDHDLIRQLTRDDDGGSVRAKGPQHGPGGARQAAHAVNAACLPQQLQQPAPLQAPSTTKALQRPRERRQGQ